MSGHKTIARLLIAAMLIATAGPALAKSGADKQTSDGKTVSKKQKPPKKKECTGTVPPWLYNPRFMNRGMLNAAKCRKSN